MPKNFIITLLIVIFSLNLLNACGIYRPVDMKNEPATAAEKRRKNIDEGKGISLKSIVGNRSTNFEFSTSNPLWRASLEILDFMPLSTVDYAGGIIITDWYNDKNNINESLKISIRFLTNEVRSDSLKITIYELTKIQNYLNDQEEKEQTDEPEHRGFESSSRRIIRLQLWSLRNSSANGSIINCNE